MIESNTRARKTGFSTIKYWIENDIEVDDIREMPIPHYRPVNYIKTSILWALYYLKHDYTFNKAIRDIISRGGDTQANAAIVGGLIGASKGINSIDYSHIKAVLTVPEKQNNLESGASLEYHPGNAISTDSRNPHSKIHGIISQAPTELVVKWDG
jgi:hypothetical protein